jgi:hypothetical protein
MKARIRDYNSLVQRLKALPPRGWGVRQVGDVWGYPWFYVDRMVGVGAPTVLLSGGMHGEEPGGVEGVFRWLEGDDWPKWRVNWLVLPCINPYGWERNQRTNGQRCDINRQFRNKSAAPEAELIKRLFQGKTFLFSIEFHEDIGTSGYYLYELRLEPPFIGEKVVHAVGKVIATNPDRIIDGRRAMGRGLIRPDADLAALKRRRRWPMAYHLFLNCTGRVLGGETPVTISLEQRARAHNVALATALDEILGRKSVFEQSSRLAP